MERDLDCIFFVSFSTSTKMLSKVNNHRTRKGDARSSAAARSGSTYTPENGESVCGTEAQNGDVVEYPLSDAIKAQHQDDRLKGLNFNVVTPNIEINNCVHVWFIFVC